MKIEDVGNDCNVIRGYLIGLGSCLYEERSNWGVGIGVMKMILRF